MKRTELNDEVLIADTEQQLPIPSSTVRIEFSTPSSFPIRVSLVQGEVAGDNLAGFIVSNEEDTEMIGRFDGPIFFAAEQPHALLKVACWSTKELLSTALTGGAFNEAFGTGFDIGT